MEGIKKAAAKYHLMVFTAAFYAKLKDLFIVDILRKHTTV